MTRRFLDVLIPAVIAGSTMPHSEIHGEQHWKCVSLVAVRAAKATPGADPLVALLFGLFHDTQRWNEDEDPEHGLRAAAYAEQFFESGRLSLSRAQAEALAFACRTHTEAGPTDDPVIGCCYDGDRLNLWRVWITPHPDYLSTEFGLESTDTEWTRDLHGEPIEWSDVLDVLFS